MYSVLDYGLMAADHVRMAAYAKAIERVVTPSSIVVDIGCGTGICALLAARAGARHVYAIDTNPAVWIAAELARENGWHDRITVFESDARHVQLPTKADVLVSDLRGKTPLAGAHLATVGDARARWLAPSGVSLPVRDTLWTCAVESPDLWRFINTGWQSLAELGCRAQAARTSILHSIHDDRQHSLPASAMLSTAKVWANVDYWNLQPSTASYTGTVELNATRRGTAHGLAVWFEAFLTPDNDVHFSNAPGNNLAYARAFLPFEEPIALHDDDRIDATISADPTGTHWSWSTRVTRARGSSFAPSVHYRQTTLLGAPASFGLAHRGALVAPTSLQSPTQKDDKYTE